METQDKEKIRETVRSRYGDIAKAGGILPKNAPEKDPPKQMLPMASCCSPPGDSTQAQGSCCGNDNFSVDQMAAYMGKLGYSREDLASAPDGANMMLGCGNPVALASLKPGETVVDLGSGGGFDCFLAAKEVGETGRVIGVDMTPDMVAKARRNAAKIQTTNVEFRLGEIEHLPVADNTADIIMSNCVINLSPDKPSVYRDAFRVLKPGGRLAISDVVARAPLPENIQKDLELVSACIGGAATIEETKGMLQDAGFTEILITSKSNSREIIETWSPGKARNAWDYVVSACIEAKKP
jgi:SAM-dependent methyltransferase